MNPTNYRRMSLDLFSKVFEKGLYIRLTDKIENCTHYVMFTKRAGVFTV
jgi:hypothetical protein